MAGCSPSNTPTGPTTSPDPVDPPCQVEPFYFDADGDGFGAGEPFLSCDSPVDWVNLPGDCNDDDPAVYPGAAERCDGLDNDCDVGTSEAGTATAFTLDGAASDLTAAFSDASAPGSWQVTAPTELRLCEGNFFAHIVAQDVDLTVRGVGGVTLSGGDLGTVLHVSGAAAVTVEGVTIEHGAATATAMTGQGEALGTVGGGVYCSGPADLVLRDTLIRASTASTGAGLYAAACTVLMQGGALQDNVASLDGGGAALLQGRFTLDGVTVAGNVATEDGGGVLVWADAEDSDLTMFDSVLEGNQAGASGGALALESGFGNAASAICLGGGAQPTRIIGNSAGISGGGLWAFARGEVDSDVNVVSDRCDWGAGVDDNTPDDLRIEDVLGGLRTYASYGPGATFLCSRDGCAEAP